MLESILSDPAMHNVYFDISWDAVAKYILASPESVRITADLLIAIRIASSLGPMKSLLRVRRNI
jgi:hypothetical protein